MKKNKIVGTVILVSLLASYLLLPINASAKTIKEFEAEVEKYTAQLQEKKNKVAKNDAEVAEIKEKISKYEAQIKTTEEEINALEEEIEKSNKEIAKKSEESKKIMEYYQISNGENAYLEYAFGATSITDMIYRMSVVEQLTEYNDNIMKELKDLIAKNKQQQQELSKKKESLKQLKKELESEKERINADTASLKEAMPGLEEQIKSAKANVSYYKALGCGASEDIQKCQFRIEQSQNSNNGGGGGGYVPSAEGFFRPMENGYVTQNWGGYGGHLGMDLSNTNKTMPIYPITNGVVFKKYYDNAGALVLKIRHNVGGRYIYSTYAHLSSWSVNEGQLVSANTMIGRMGNTGNSYGAHLHLEITTCDWNKGGGCTWAQYQKSTINPRNYVGFPSSLRSWWYGR